ncbi:MAG: chitobiase/beta-hexosaminidase C-terminal domain-containing protein, partial [Sphingobacteriales bacterium]|nr:chitobiase/beta-hexosaminidase C-terminal domain-containing protein [Sphingobacteriales bacterium]
ITGHQGANITHGENFLLAPITPEKTAPKVLLEDAYVFNDMVKPIIQSKCISCHNSQKAKGNLIMETEALLLKGGKNGKLWDLNEAEFGLMLHRLHLPEDAKKHMPPKGKPQLSEEELQVIYYWVKGGADFKKKVMDLPEQDTLRILAASIFNTIETDDYSFAAADEKIIKSLNNNYRVVYPLAQESPALGVDFYGVQFYQPKQLEELLKVKEQVVTLNLNKMPVKDEELKTIAQFTNLRKLNLSFSGITGKTIGELLKLKELKHLSLSGTTVKLSDVSQLNSLKKLTHLDLWNTNVKDEEIKTLLAANKTLIIETGYKGDTDIIKLNAPMLENESFVIDTPVHLQLKHFVHGVVVRYTLDGTEPDSLHSPVYDKNVMLTKNVLVKTKAFKPGWISSDILETYFYAAKIKGDTVINILPADSAFRGNGSRTIIDLVKGETTNFGNGKWVGYHGKKMESIIGFNTSQTVSSVTLSTLIDIGSYIMPPVSIQVWGAGKDGKYRKLNSLSPAQPTAVSPAYLKGFEMTFAPVTVKAIKIIAVPVAKLPAWHPGKGDKGWIFIDEVFIN